MTTVTLVTEVSPELSELFAHAHRDVLAKRGGVALLATLAGPTPEGELLANAVASRSLWTLSEDGELKGFAMCRERVVEAVYVAHPFRRQRVATTLVRALLATDPPPLDAYALPGDRGMKSLYESIGWKARLLTMRGA